VLTQHLGRGGDRRLDGDPAALRARPRTQAEGKKSRVDLIHTIHRYERLSRVTALGPQRIKPRKSSRSHILTE
jgi:hypothetical protein